jgi:hypothetical protein
MPSEPRFPVGTVRPTKNGYWRVKLPNGKWQLQHIAIAEELLGRPLRENERVFFRNGIKKDPTANDIEVRLGTRESRTARSRRRRNLINHIEKLRSQLQEAEAELAAINTSIGRPPGDTTIPTKGQE